MIKFRTLVTAFFVAIATFVSIYKFLFDPPPVVRKFLLDIFSQYPLTSTIYKGLQLIFSVPLMLLIIYLAVIFLIDLFASMWPFDD